MTLDSSSKGQKSRQTSIIYEDDLHLTSCGIGSWRPKWLQIFATAEYFMATMALVGVVQGMTGSIFYSSSSTLEKRYGFDSKLTGIIMIMDNFAEIFLNPLVGFLSVRYNRARLIAFGEVFVAISCFLTAMPFFIYGPATHLLTDDSLLSKLTSNDTNFEMCNDLDRADCSNGPGGTLWLAVFFLLVGSFTRGLGYTCYVVVGLPFLDDNTSKKNSPLYISIMQSLRLIGPAAGFMLSAFCLRFYENPLIDPGIAQTDPRFIGAWWLSFIVVAILLLIATLPMFFFPGQLKSATVKTADIQAKIKANGGSLGALKRFVTNPLVMLCTFANAFRYFGLFGYFVYKSKYVEAQFRRSSSSASFIAGTASFAPMAIGILLGGWILSYLKPRPRVVFILVFLCESVSLFTIGSGFFLGCNPLKIDGQLDQVGEFSLNSTCNDNCQCTTNVYTPICGPDSMTTYFSPCHAGCNSFNSLNSTFQDCSCFQGAATKGYCQSDVIGCTNLIPYISIVTIGGIISSIARTPNSLIALRNVDPMDKAFAIGIATMAMDILAFIPCSIVFGYIIDSACLIWESKCNKTGNCWVYDHDKFRNYLHGATFICLVAASCLDFVTIFFAGRVQNFYEDDEDEVEKEKINKMEQIELKSVS